MDSKTCLEPYLEKQLKGHRKAITSIFFSPNEQQIATSSLDNSVLLWDFKSNMRSYRFEGHEEGVMDVSFSPSGKFMASASQDKTVRLWVPTVVGSTGMFKAHSQTVRSVQFTPDSLKIISASDDKIVKLWSVDKFKFITSFVGHTNWVRCARISNDGSVIASCSDDKSTRLWDPVSGKCIHTYKDQKGPGVHLAWHPSGCYIAIGTGHGNVKLFDVRTHTLVQYYSIHSSQVNQISFHPSGSYILTASKDGKMKMLDLLEGHPIFTMLGHEGPINAVNFSPSGGTIASAGDDKIVCVWKTNFTELDTDMKENISQNQLTEPRSSSQTTKCRGKNQGPRKWYLCYHRMTYPVVTFVHIDTPEDEILVHEPIANNDIIGVNDHNVSNSSSRHLRSSTPLNDVSSKNSNNTHTSIHSCPAGKCPSDSVGHISHIPRTPPTPGTYTVPSIILNKSIITDQTHTGNLSHDDLFGLVKLKGNDVCYTSGTIEWVGRKRSYPINSGFKQVSEKNNQDFEFSIKKSRVLNKTFTVDGTGVRECDCTDMLPTVNAIVDHLNALHEAVDIVDLRLSRLEDTTSKKH